MKRIEHLGIAVESLETAIPLYEALLNTSCYKQEAVASEGVRTAFFQVGESKIELLENNVLQLNNNFMLTYFLNGKLYDKNFTFEANTIKDENTTELNTINRIGIIGK